VEPQARDPEEHYTRRDFLLLKIEEVAVDDTVGDILGGQLRVHLTADAGLAYP